MSLYDKSVRGGYGGFIYVIAADIWRTYCLFCLFFLAKNFLCPFSGYVFVTRVFSFIYFSNERNHLSAKFTTACTAYWKGRITPVLLRNGVFRWFFFFLAVYISHRNEKYRAKKNTHTSKYSIEVYRTNVICHGCFRATFSLISSSFWLPY